MTRSFGYRDTCLDSNFSFYSSSLVNVPAAGTRPTAWSPYGGLGDVGNISSIPEAGRPSRLPATPQRQQNGPAYTGPLRSPSYTTVLYVRSRLASFGGLRHRSR